MYIHVIGREGREREGGRVGGREREIFRTENKNGIIVCDNVDLIYMYMYTCVHSEFGLFCYVYMQKLDFFCCCIDDGTVFLWSSPIGSVVLL